MSVTQVPLRPIARGSLTKLWLAIAILVVAAFALAKLGTDRFQRDVSATGLEFRTVEDGTGEPITLQDAALIEYNGTFDDGQVFDSTEQRGPQPIAPIEMIPGFREAMLKMKEGGRYRFRMPPELAYGTTPPPGMRPNAALNFDVHVIKVGRGAAAMAAQAAQQQQMQQQIQGGAPEPTPAP